MTIAAPEGFPPPRPFQVEAIEALRGHIRRQIRSLILCAPTGAGKTYTAMWLANLTLAKGKRVVFIADRISLIDQTSRVADGYGLDHGVIQANHPRRAPEKPFQIASTQTLARRGEVPAADVYIIDEAHTQYEETLKLLRAKKAVIIGLTATPCTAGLKDHFDELINAVTMEKLTEDGVLVPLRAFKGPVPDMKGVRKLGGEWTAGGAERPCVLKIEAVVREWQAKGQGRKTIAFGPTIGYAQLLADAFNAADIRAASYTMSTPSRERKELLEEFRKSDSAIRVLTSVEALGKGFDVPDVGCIVDARPFQKSMSAVIQMWGRGVRAAPGKTDCVLLDCSGNVGRFWRDFSVIFQHGFETLRAAEEADEEVRDGEEKACPQCKAIPFATHCAACGYSEIGNTVEIVDGALDEEALRLCGWSRRSLWEQICAYMEGSRTPAQKRAWRARFTYRDFTGEFPPQAWSYRAGTRGCPGELKRRIWARDAAWRRQHPRPGSLSGVSR